MTSVVCTTLYPGLYPIYLTLSFIYTVLIYLFTN